MIVTSAENADMIVRWLGGFGRCYRVENVRRPELLESGFLEEGIVLNSLELRAYLEIAKLRVFMVGPDINI